MALVRWNRNIPQNPFSEFDRLQDEMSRLFGLVNQVDQAGLFDGAGSPPVDVIDEGESIVVICDLPGMDRKDVELSIASNVLTIKGERKARDEKRKAYKNEVWTGRFQRTLSLPPQVDPTKVKAEMTDGVLRIRIDKQAESKPRQIAITVK